MSTDKKHLSTLERLEALRALIIDAQRLAEEERLDKEVVLTAELELILKRIMGKK